MGTLALLHLGLLVGVLHGAMGVTLNVEEGFPAYVASRLLAGSPDVAPTRLAYTVYESGTTMMGALAAPSMWVVGPTLLGLKVASIAVSVAGVVVFAGWAMAWLGDRAGLAAGLLFAVGPPALIFRGVQTLGDTSEVLPFLALTWLLLERVRRRGPRPHLLLALGVASGLGVSFSYALVPSCALLALALAASRHAAPVSRRALAILGLGVLVGLAIPLTNALVYGVPVLEVRGRRPGEMLSGLSRWLASLVALATGATTDFDYGHARGEALHPCVAIQRAVSLAVFAASAWHERQVLARLPFAPFRDVGPIPPLAWAVALHATYLAAYCTTAVQSHYLLVLLAPTDAILAAALVLRIAQRRRAAHIAIVGLALLHLVPIAPLWSWSPARRPLYDAPAASDHDWGWRIWGYAPADALAREHVDPAHARGAGQSLGEDGLDRTLVELATRHPLHAVDLASGYGYGVAWRDLGAPGSVAELVALPEGLRAAALEGFGRCLGQRFPWALGYQHALDAVGDADERVALLTGYGDGLGWRMWHDPAAFASVLDAAEDEDRGAIGHGLALRLETMCDDRAERDRRWEQVPEGFRPRE